VTVHLQPFSHLFFQKKQAGALSNDSSDLEESFSTVVASVWQIKLGSVKSARRKARLTIHSNWKSQTNYRLTQRGTYPTGTCCMY